MSNETIWLIMYIVSVAIALVFISKTVVNLKRYYLTTAELDEADCAWIVFTALLPFINFLVVLMCCVYYLGKKK